MASQLVPVSRDVPTTVDILSTSTERGGVEVAVINPYIVGLHTDGHKVARFIVRARRAQGFQEDRRVQIRHRIFEDDTPQPDDELFDKQYDAVPINSRAWVPLSIVNRLITRLDGNAVTQHTVELYHRVEVKVSSPDESLDESYILDSPIVPIHV